MIVPFSEARANFKQVCDTAVNDCAPVTIFRRDAENVVIMSESEFNSWRETIYLLSNPANAKHLLTSIEQVKSGKVSAHELQRPEDEN